MGSLYMNLSIKYKIFILFYSLIVLITLTLGYYSYQTSSKQIVNKVSVTNLGIIREIDNNISSLRKNIADWVSVFSLSSEIQNLLVSSPNQTGPLDTQLYSGPTASLMNQMLVTMNFDYWSLYGQSTAPLFQESTDGSSGSFGLDFIKKSEIYKRTAEMNGASYWFPLTADNNVFIQDNRNDKLGMTRIIRNVKNGSPVGFIFVGINNESIRKSYLKNLYDQDHGILIIDKSGFPVLKAGLELYDSQSQQLIVSKLQGHSEAGSMIIDRSGEELLVSYSEPNDYGWRVLYAVPLALLTKELSSIKVFVVVLILGCLLLSIPFMVILTTFLTAPIKTLLRSMKRFQNGHFNERVDIKYRDEIGELSRGYNSMVANIKTLVDDAYVLHIKEQEAELKALQSQINPHFLYNMLDTIFWEAEAAGQSRISEMIVNLSRLFRLSLNRGKSFTSVSKEKELISLYLALQQMRFNDLLQYRIDIPDDLDDYVILKLTLQPFIENAINHGIESKRGGGTLTVTGSKEEDSLVFVIEDDGAGMDEATVRSMLEVKSGTDVYTAKETGGYGVQNVVERLRHYYKDRYSLKVTSEPGTGTRVKMKIPAVLENKEV